jgi:hypothetical protein
MHKVCSELFAGMIYYDEDTSHYDLSARDL